MAFGSAAHGALTALVQALASRFEDKLKRYLDQWQSGCKGRQQLSAASNDGGRLYEISCNTLCSHEDRIYPGALIASLAIPWGEVRTATQSPMPATIWSGQETPSTARARYWRPAIATLPSGL